MGNYFLGLDIGTNSIGYVATDEQYNPLKFKGSPIMGVTLFEEAKLKEKRRTLRTGRRRLNRRKQRVLLVREIFAREIDKVDPRFFIRLEESALWRDDASSKEDCCVLFNDEGFNDGDYHKEYPTIHHLICELINNPGQHDVRLVYLACAWLVSHRGHFLSPVSKDQAGRAVEFKSIYDNFMNFFDLNKPWNCEAEEFGEILKTKTNVKRKEKAFYDKLFGGKKPIDRADESACETDVYSRTSIISLLCGGTVAPKKLFLSRSIEYEQVESFTLGADDEKLNVLYEELGDDSELVILLKSMYDWAILEDIRKGEENISESKITVYERHKSDLKNLKTFVRKYIPEKYGEIFIAHKKENYAAYAYHPSNKKIRKNPEKKATKEEFCKYLKKTLKDIKPCPEDEEFFGDMMSRLDTYSFLPKQKDSDNRVIPFQLYYAELDKIMKNARRYLPFLSETDSDGISSADKILSIMEFKIPYFVGPLNKTGNFAWIERKSDKIYPWNFDKIVDLDASEENFIGRMTNQCSYLPGEDVLPKHSLLYSKFTVLNEINNIQINGVPISAELKRKLYDELFSKNKKVSRKAIENYFKSSGYLTDGAAMTGVDIEINSSLKSYVEFGKLLKDEKLNEGQVESIIYRITITEDKSRVLRRLDREFPQLTPEDRKYIHNRVYKDFGRLSRKFLSELRGTDKKTGQTYTIIEAMRETNLNLNQLLSDDFTFTENIKLERELYYKNNPQSLSDRLDGMYVSNAVKRPILLTLDIIREISKVRGGAPGKIFIEMSRAVLRWIKKGKRTKTRRQQIEELYKKFAVEDMRSMRGTDLNFMSGQLKKYDNSSLQNIKLYLYFMQLGKCMYTGETIDIERLINKDENIYDIEHIWPQSKIMDDSIVNNKALVLGTVNSEKKDNYPISAEIRHKMSDFWKLLHKNNLISTEKFSRLTRTTPFSPDERWNFINRQLVETRQSTKALAEILKEKYPEGEVVYVKSGLVSEFRHEFKIEKSRSLNDLHHAKDAYLTIVTGNVYHEKFTKKWFETNNGSYNLKIKTLFTHEVCVGGKLIWAGEKSIGFVKTIVAKNNIKTNRFSFCRKGGLFDQNPLRAGKGEVSRKRNLPVEKYGGYAKTTASFFVLVKYDDGKKNEVMVMPVELMVADRFLSDKEFAIDYATETINKITGKQPVTLSFPLKGRILKVNTLFSLDGFRGCLGGKSSGGTRLLISPFMPLRVDFSSEAYIKRIESFIAKKTKNNSLKLNSFFDKITKEENMALYELLLKKLTERPYSKRPNNPANILESGKERFANAEIEAQVDCLGQIISLFGAGAGGHDLRLIGGKESSGESKLSSSLSNWKKYYSDVRIIDQSSACLFEKQTENLLELL